MALSIRPTGREISLDESSFIVTKTDMQGRITYANRVFMQISGYREAELLGQPQNIVRHPDMPKGLFRHLWQVIKNGDECFAYINNLAKNGDNYWVFANITPDFDDRGNITGFFSCRRKPHKQAIEKLTPLYQKMLEIERQQSQHPSTASLDWLKTTITKQHNNYEEFVLGL